MKPFKKQKSRLKSYFLNSKKKYTKFGIVYNWLIFIVPIVLIIMCVAPSPFTGHTLKELQDPANVTMNEKYWLFFFFVLIVFEIFLVVYKIFRRIIKPKKVRKNWLKSDIDEDSKEDSYWG